MTLVYVGPVIIGAHAAVVFSYYCFIFTKGIIETVCHIKRVNKKTRQQKSGRKRRLIFVDALYDQAFIDIAIFLSMKT